MPPKPDDKIAGDGALLRVDELSTFFAIRAGKGGRKRASIRAVDRVSFSIRRGRTLGLVGESGCGKTTLGRTILRLIPATSGRVFFDGMDVFALDAAAMRRLRTRMQIIFQDPAGSLNPRMTIGEIVGEAAGIHGVPTARRENGPAESARRRRPTARALREHVVDLLGRVGLSADDVRRYPHEFSGGQRQRIGIARALSLDPEFVVCDEPVSALDVSIQSQVLNLLSDLRRELGLTYLFIAHNLAVVRHISDDVAVMYLGRIVEQASTEELFRHPRHPYTHALLAAAPEPDPAARHERVALSGEVPSPLDPPSGCAFHPRCPFAEDRCRREKPLLAQTGGVAEGHVVACHRAEELGSEALRAGVKLP